MKTLKRILTELHKRKRIGAHLDVKYEKLYCLLCFFEKHKMKESRNKG
jgi:hypothetical protein